MILDEKYENIKNLVSKIFGEQTTSKFNSVSGDGNRPGGTWIILDYIVRSFISPFDFPDDKEICSAIIQELESTKTEIDNDIKKLREIENAN